MPTTDFLQLNQSGMFAKIRSGGLPEDKQFTQNLIESKDDLLYAWDAAESCLLVLNWRAALQKGHNQVNYQIPLPALTSLEYSFNALH